MTSPQYIVITPVRNEVKNLPRTIESFAAQTFRPLRWILVNDGSTDGTAELVDEAAARYPWISAVHRPDRGHRLPGTGVMEAFNQGLEQLGGTRFDFLVKFDADLAFEPDYFERCLRHFELNPRLGIGGGTICRLGTDGLVPESTGDPAFHVRGATKIYRRTCWDQLGGLIQVPGWDTVDELKANMLGWETKTFSELSVHQLKATGSADGDWRNWVKNGVANYNTGYHPLFMAAKCLRRLFRKPYILSAAGLGWGFFRSWAAGAPRPIEPELLAYVHRQQLSRLRGQSSLWDARRDKSATT